MRGRGECIGKRMFKRDKKERKRKDGIVKLGKELDLWRREE